MIETILLGCGGTMPQKDRHLTALLLKYNNKSILIDAGEGTQMAIDENNEDLEKIDTILFTHLHADHIAGLPGLLLTIGNRGRRDKLHIYGPKDIDTAVRGLRVIAPNLKYEIEVHKIEDEEFTFTWNNDIEVTAFKVLHDVATYGYSFKLYRAGAFKRSLAVKYSIPKIYYQNLKNKEVIEVQGHTYDGNDFVGPVRTGIKVTYVTDSRPVDSIVRNAFDSDLFICECMYTSTDKLIKAIMHRHMIALEAAEVARNAKVKEVWFTHFSPSEHPEESDIEEARSIFGNGMYLGKDGMRKTLNIRKD